jgi:hypothetical protein
MTRLARALLFFFSLSLTACAPALPSFSGGRTTPDGRVDVALGASVRAPLGDLARPADQEVLGLTSPGGVAPAGFFRVGLVRGWDMGVLVAGTNGRIELRGSTRLGSMARAIVGVSGYGGYLVRENDPGGQGNGDAFRAGALVPIVISLDMGGVVEGWGGLRLGYEHVGGNLHPMAGGVLTGDANAFRGGLVLGLALGLLRVHALIELAADYEYWRGQLDGVAFERQGIALTPSFGVRVRF